MSRVCNTTTEPSTAQTPHYHLPQWEGSTITSWLTQMNYAMRRIDDVIWSLALQTGINGLPDETVAEVVRLSNWSAEITEEVKTICTNVEELTTGQANINESIASILVRLNTLTTNTTNLDTRMATIESRMDGLETALAKLETNLNDLTDRVTALENKEVV